MTTTQTRKYGLLAGAILLSLSAITFAESELDAVSIPVMDNAKVFANFTEEMPAVLNYFTSASEIEVIDFYQQHLGAPISQERKRGRLTLTFQNETQDMRVVISQQGEKRQVDILVEKM